MMTTTDDLLNAPVATYVCGTPIPEHWRRILKARAEAVGGSLTAMVTFKLHYVRSEYDIDLAAAENGYSHAQMKLHLLRDAFPDLPPWNDPPFKPRPKHTNVRYPINFDPVLNDKTRKYLLA